jgi:hypothetical protein
MDTTPPTAWQPLTPRGVAAFAQGSLRRLLLVQLIVALLVALAVVWFLSDGYFPVVSKAIGQLPATGEVSGGRLTWGGDTPVLLAENRLLAVSVDLEESAKIRSAAHVQLELGRTHLFVRSLFGYLAVNYPTGWRIAVNREELQPLWGAWHPAILAGALIGVVLGLFATWFGLATLWAGPVWLFSFYLNREINLRGSWRLCGAALMPGALLMVGALSFYDLGVMDLVQLTFVFGVHLVMGWVYLVLSPLFLQRVSAVVPGVKNPFAAKK